MAAQVPIKYSAMEPFLQPSWKDLKKENKMYGYYPERRKELTYTGLMFEILGSGINSLE